MAKIFNNFRNSRHAKAQIQSKSKLARIMARENITVEHSANAKTAAFDTQARHLVLPIYKDMTEDENDMLVSHEVSHALFTPRIDKSTIDRIDPVHTKRALKYFNIVEDARIERLIKDRYPGLRTTYVNGYREMVRRGALISIRQDQLHKLPFIDRLNVYAKIGFMWDVPFTAKESQFAERLTKTETFEDVMQLTKDIYKFARDQASGQGESEEEDETGEGEGKTKKTKSKTGKGNSSGKGGSGKSKSGSGSGRPSPSAGGQSQGSGSSGSGMEEDTDFEGPGGDGEEEDESDTENGDEGDEEGNEDFDDDGEEEGSGSKSPTGEVDGNDEGKGALSTENNGADTDGKGKTVAPPKFGSMGSATDTLTKYGGAKQAPVAFSNAGDAPESVTDELFSGSEIDSSINTSYNNIFDADCANPENIVIPWDEVHKTIADSIVRHKASGTHKQGFQTWLSGIRPDIEYMAREFDLKKAAESYSKQRQADSGIIDPKKLVHYKYADDVFRKSTLVHHGKNHGMLMFIDWSGSMAGSAKGTLLQVMALAMYCRRIRVPFEVYAFTDEGYSTTKRKGAQFNVPIVNPLSQKYGSSAMRLSAVSLFQLLSSSMKIADWNKSMEQLYYTATENVNGFSGMGGTPLNETVIAAMKIVPAFRKRHNVQIMSTVFLTDGDGHCYASIAGNKGHTYMQEQKSGLSIQIKQDSYAHRRVTEALMDSLAMLTGTKVIGFYLTGKNNARAAIADRMPPEIKKSSVEIERMVNHFREKKWVSIDGAPGYDEFFILPGDDLDLTGTKGLLEKTLKGNASEHDVQIALTKVAAAGKTNRVLLGRFVERMAKEG